MHPDTTDMSRTRHDTTAIFSNIHPSTRDIGLATARAGVLRSRTSSQMDALELVAAATAERRGGSDYRNCRRRASVCRETRPVPLYLNARITTPTSLTD